MHCPTTTQETHTMDKLDDYLLDLLADGLSPEDVAHTLVDADVATGEYEGCSAELEMAFTEYQSQAARLLAAVSAPDDAAHHNH